MMHHETSTSIEKQDGAAKLIGIDSGKEVFYYLNKM